MLNGLKTEFSDLSNFDILNQSVVVLVGINDSIEKVLARMTIYTVGDLGGSKYFLHANQLTKDKTNRFIPADWVDISSRGLTQEAFKKSSPDILLGLSTETAKYLSDEAGIQNLYDMANWEPFVTALSFYRNDKVSGILSGRDEANPLLPVARTFATESRYYEQALMDVSLTKKNDEEFVSTSAIFHLDTVDRQFSLTHSDRFILDLLQPLTDEIPTPNHLLDVFAPIDEGFTFPALGGLLRFKQAWVPHGLSLGNLLHSIALAPGEATRVAITEWSRKLSGSVAESSDDTESLTAGQQQSRSIDEVQNSILSEELDSSDDLNNSSDQSQANVSGSVTGGNGFVSGQVTAGASAASSKSRAIRVLNSRGRKSVGAEVAQRISSATQQQSSLARSRRASSIHEVRENESQTVTSRVIANYNHMHALTMYYYEVVQIFNMHLSINEASPLLFIPFKLIDFTREEVIQRFRRPLLAAAINNTDRKIIEDVTNMIVFDLKQGQSKLLFEFDQTVTSLEIYQEYGRIISSYIYLKKQEGENTARVVHTVYHSTLEGSIRNGSVQSTASASPFKLSAIDRIEVHVSPLTFTDVSNYENDVAITRSKWREAHLNISFDADYDVFTKTLLISDSPSQTLIKRREKQLFGQSSITDAINTLQASRVHYSQVIWQTLDRHTLSMLLSNYEIGGVQAIELVEPDIVVTRGNLMGFRLSVGTKDNPVVLSNYGNLYEWWQKWQKRHVESAEPIEEQVPMPTGGIHGEAVLGQSNCAEKIDLTRFWDWQESPIPLVPDSFSLKTPGGGSSVAGPTQMGASNLQIQAAQAYPPGATLGETMKALSSESLVAATADASAIQNAAASAMEAATKMNEQGLDASASAAAAAQAIHLAHVAKESSIEKTKITADAKVKIAQTGAKFAAALETQNNVLKQTNTRIGGMLEALKDSALGQVFNINIENDNSSETSSSASTTNASKHSSSNNNSRKPSKPTPQNNSQPQSIFNFGDFTLNLGNNNSFTINPKPESGRTEPRGTFVFIKNLINIDFGDNISTTDNSSNDHINTGDKIEPSKKNEPSKTYKGPGGYLIFNFSFDLNINAPIINIKDSFNSNEDNSSIIIIIQPDGFKIKETDNPVLSPKEEQWFLDINSADYSKVKSFILLALESIRDTPTHGDGLLDLAIKKFKLYLSEGLTAMAEVMMDVIAKIVNTLDNKSLEFVANLLLNSGLGPVLTDVNFHKTNQNIGGIYKGSAVVLGGKENTQSGQVLKSAPIPFLDGVNGQDIFYQDAYHLRFGSLQLSEPLSDKLSNLIAEVVLNVLEKIIVLAAIPATPAPIKAVAVPLALLKKATLLDNFAEMFATTIIAILEKGLGDEWITMLNFSAVEVKTKDMQDISPSGFTTYSSPEATPENSPIIIYESNKDIVAKLS